MKLNQWCVKSCMYTKKSMSFKIMITCNFISHVDVRKHVHYREVTLVLVGQMMCIVRVMKINSHG